MWGDDGRRMGTSLVFGRQFHRFAPPPPRDPPTRSGALAITNLADDRAVSKGPIEVESRHEIHSGRS